MEGLIMNFRGGKHTKYDNQMILEIAGSDSREKARKFLEKKVVWTSPAGKKISGKITQLHGNKGRLRVHFEKGMPGQSLSSKVEVS